jgi:hypothetical protein
MDSILLGKLKGKASVLLGDVDIDARIILKLKCERMN